MLGRREGVYKQMFVNPFHSIKNVREAFTEVLKIAALYPNIFIPDLDDIFTVVNEICLMV